MKERTASCACGTLTALCRGEPISVSACYCRQCQRRTGSTFGLAAFFPLEAVAIEGPYKSFSRVADSGYEITFHFCPNCGSSVFWHPARKPGVVALASGAFADPDFPAPTKEAHPENRQSWVRLMLPEAQ